MGSEGPPAFTVHVTGFKKFHGVSQDPTETVVSNLKEFIEKMGLPDGITLCSCTILETAGNGGLPKLVELTDSVLPQSFLDSASNEQIIWVHFGVNSGGTKFANESQAVNESTFRCPDEPCWQPQGGGYVRRYRSICLQLHILSVPPDCRAKKVRKLSLCISHCFQELRKCYLQLHCWKLLLV